MSNDHHSEYHQANDLYNEGKFEEAMVLLEIGLHDQPSSKHLLYAYGKCLVATHRIPEAQAVCDRIAIHRSSSAREMVTRLQAKIDSAKRGEYRHKKKKKEAPKPHTGRIIAGSVVGGLVVLLGGILFFFGGNGGEEVGMQRLSWYAPALEGPDSRVELAILFPADAANPTKLIVAMSSKIPPASEDRPSQKLAECVASNWKKFAPRVRKGIRMCYGSGASQETTELPAYTAVLPRSDHDLPPCYMGTETFFPGKVHTLDTAREACGDEDREETWERQGVKVGIRGKVHWWGAAGIAVDSAGEITHLLLRPETTRL